MYDIEASVTTADKDQLGLTGDWPLDWLHAVGFRSTEIIRKLGPTEKLSRPGVATERRELPGNRGFHLELQIGDRGVVRLFFSGESRQQQSIVISPEIQFWIDHKNEAQKAQEALGWFRDGSITEKSDEELTVISSIPEVERDADAAFRGLGRKRSHLAGAEMVRGELKRSEQRPTASYRQSLS
jgi:hypothetical protein